MNVHAAGRSVVEAAAESRVQYRRSMIRVLTKTPLEVHDEHDRSPNDSSPCHDFCC